MKKFNFKNIITTLLFTFTTFGAFANSSEDPVGIIVMWGQTTVPEGWVEAAGQSTNINPDLIAIYGANLPDLRGNFVRGYGGNSGKLGEIQGQEIKSHSHTASFIGNALPTHGHTYSAYNGNTESHGNKSNDLYDNNRKSYTTGATSGGTPTGTVNVTDTGEDETRPTNIALKYIIKVQ